MKIRFGHVNLISSSWRSLADFYIKVFGCVEKKPQRDLKGEWVDSLTNLKDAHIKGVHLLLPGFDDDGPTLEIFEYDENIRGGEKEINKEGFGHIAFAVDDVKKCVDLILSNGGSLVGEIIESYVEGVGNIAVAYCRDIENNIIEIQKWSN